MAVTAAGVLTQAVSGSPLANVLVATLSVAALVALPFLSASSPRAKRARFGYCVLGILPAVVAGVAVPTGSDPTGVPAAVMVLSLATVRYLPDRRDTGAVIAPRTTGGRTPWRR